MTNSLLIYDYIFPSLPSNWKIEPFNNWVDFQEGPGILAKDFKEKGIPLLRLKSINNRIASLNGCNFLDPNKVKTKWDHFRLKEGDLLLSSSASLGRVSEVDAQTTGSIAYTGIIRMRPLKKGIEKGFIKYFLQSNFFKKQIKLSATGSVINHFGPMHLNQMSIVIPPIDDQKEIVDILGILDEKIQLNEKKNRTLEFTAKRLFKSWFIDFDPVREKKEKKPIGLSKEICDLFPDSFEDSELGKIPKGWQVKSLYEIAEFLNGLALQKYPAIQNQIKYPVLKIAQLREGSTKNQDEYSSMIPEKYIINNRDYIFAWSASLIAKFWIGGKAALNQHLFKVTSKKYSMWFIVGWIEKHLLEFTNIASSKATSMGHIKREDLKNALTVIPPKEILSISETIFEPIRERANICLLENNVLKELRDALVAKLIVGEIIISDIKKHINEDKI
jgi:type I restriction enzyme S subunit